MKRQPIYCDICNKKITLLNYKTKRGDSNIICKHCTLKVGKDKVKTSSLSTITSAMRKIDFKKAVELEEKEFSFRAGVITKKPNKKSLFKFEYSIENKIIEYKFPSISFYIADEFRELEYKHFEEPKLVYENGYIMLYNKDILYGILYEGALSEYLKKIVNDDRYFIDIFPFKINNKTFQVSIGIYKEFNKKDLDIASIIKTNIIKTKNIAKVKSQEYINQLKAKDIVYIQYIKDKYIVVNDKNERLGELPKDIKKYIEKRDDVSYIGYIDQIYRLYNGLKTFDIRIIPMEF